VLDNFDRAMIHGTDLDPDAFHQGVEMISRQLWEMLQRRGLEVMDPLGRPFEPEYHEAVQRVEDPGHEAGTVAAVLAKGFLFGGKLIRPAMVAVAVAPTTGGVADDDESENAS
jgi:molecular chaperone GrpE